MKRTTLLNKSSKGKIKTWEIWTESGGYVCREWWLGDGKHQITRDLVEQKNLGKANETSLDEQAELEAQRILEKKREEGYSELTNASQKIELINWDTAEIDSRFAPSKPEVSIEPEDEQSILESGYGRYQRKWNGMCVVVIKGHSRTRIYSRRLEDKSDNFPHFIDAINSCKDIPCGTIIHGELEINDNPDLVKEIFGSKSETSLLRQAEFAAKGWFPNIRQFDCLYSEYYDITHNNYEYRYNRLVNVNSHIMPVENLKIKPTDIDTWEGLVFRDISSRTYIREDGKPNRKSGSWKKKNFTTIDVVATSYEFGKGKNNDRPAKLNIGMYRDGKFVKMGDCGSGLCDSHKDDLLNGTVKLPCVIEIKMEEVTEKLKFRLPIFLRWRNLDKKPEECLLDEII